MRFFFCFSVFESLFPHFLVLSRSVTPTFLSTSKACPISRFPQSALKACPISRFPQSAPFTPPATPTKACPISRFPQSTFFILPAIPTKACPISRFPQSALFTPPATPTPVTYKLISTLFSEGLEREIKQISDPLIIKWLFLYG
jgi:hypothetical protein